MNISNININNVPYTITDTTIPSYIKSIKQSDIENWNSKTSYTGTITGIIMNGSYIGTSGIIDLGNVITSHQSIKTINNQSLIGSGNITISGGDSESGLPSVTSSDNGKILMVVNGEWSLVNPVSLYTGTGTPDNNSGTNGDLYIQTQS